MAQHGDTMCACRGPHISGRGTRSRRYCRPRIWRRSIPVRYGVVRRGPGACRDVASTPLVEVTGELVMTLGDLEQQDDALRREADGLLARHGILDILARFGKPHISGSYSLRLMTWRDLDIYLEMRPVDKTRFLELGRLLGDVLNPRKLSFTDHLNFPATEPVNGLYWGIQTDILSRGGWKMDIWGVSPDECAARLAHCSALAARLEDRERHAILAIKNELCRDPRYRNTIASQDVYDAVLLGRASSIIEFWRFVEDRLGRDR